jgi:subtilisin family serine protease
VAVVTRLVLRLKPPCRGFPAALAALLWLGAQLEMTGFAAAPGGPSAFREGRLLIQPKPDADRAQLARFHQSQHARVFREFPAMAGMQVLEVEPGVAAVDLVARYQRSGLVSWAEPDFRLTLADTPNDPRFLDGTLWHLRNLGTPGADIGAATAWDTLHSASNVIVAIIDTGIRYTHEDLAANLWVNPGEIPGNGVDDDGDGFVDDVYGINAAANNGNPIDVLGHGTQVAGFIGGVGNNGLGTVGVAWRVKLMACRFYDDAGNGFLSDAVQAIDFARLKGAQVMNASFVSTTQSSALFTAINSCRTAGIIFVAAAGNDTQNTDLLPYYPAGFDLDNIVAVGATTRTDDLAYFSNYGATTVDLAAPGLDVYSTANTADAAYAMNSGTSFSSPIVAGAFALMRARFPAEGYRQLIDRVLAATDPLPALAGKCVSGGRLNLARALGAAVAVDFSATPSSGPIPLTVSFANRSFGAITNLLWDFGDGSTSTSAAPVHVYTAAGNYQPRLTITSTGGIVLTTNHPVTALVSYQMTNASFAWVDPAGMTPLPLTGNDVSAAQTLPFGFQFYGQTYSLLFVGANGLLGFESSGISSAANADLPNSAAPNNMICPFWDDLNPASGAVRFGSVGVAPNRRAVISWVNVPPAGGGPQASFTFQVVLEETSNAILFQYLSVQPGSRNNSAAGKSATVGIEHTSGLFARKYSYNGSTLLADNQAIRFIPNAGALTNRPPPAPVTLFNARRVGNDFAFSFLSQTGVTYSIQASPVLPSTNWQLQQSLIGTGGTLDRTNTGLSNQLFFRVEAR